HLASTHTQKVRALYLEVAPLRLSLVDVLEVLQANAFTDVIISATGEISWYYLARCEDRRPLILASFNAYVRAYRRNPHRKRSKPSFPQAPLVVRHVPPRLF